MNARQIREWNRRMHVGRYYHDAARNFMDRAAPFTDYVEANRAHFATIRQVQSAAAYRAARQIAGIEE